MKNYSGYNKFMNVKETGEAATLTHFVLSEENLPNELNLIDNDLRFVVNHHRL